MSRRVATQPDLLDLLAPPLTDDERAEEQAEHEEVVQMIRAELHGSLARARATTQGFPWRDLTETYAIEIRVNSKSRWLPDAEAAALRRVFSAEMDRLYEAANEQRPLVGGLDF